MSDPIEVLRDCDGIAHIRAPDPYGAFFGQGYAAAQDRLRQMEYDRCRASGRLAEALGLSALASDLFNRRLDLAGAAQRDHDALSDPARMALAAYADGVNAWLGRVGSEDLPPELDSWAIEVERWRPWHSIAVFKVRHVLMGTYELKLWRSGLIGNVGSALASRLWPSERQVTVMPTDDLAHVARDLVGDLETATDALAAIPDGGGSNNLAVDGRRTSTGLPLLAGDPHRLLDLPSTYWPNHLRCPDFDAIGLSFPGVPGFPHFGHNGRVAWCITHGMADDQDLFLERLRPGRDCVEYQYDGAWREAAARHHTIRVAGAEAVELTTLETQHGPVIATTANGDHGLVLRWTALATADTSFDTLVPMLGAASVAELDEAMRGWVAPVNNVLFADRDGTIAYRLRGRLAVRPRPNRWAVVAGWTGEHEWTGWVDYDDQPGVVDPDRGFLVTANNRPAVDGPYISNDFGHPGRAQRLTTLLAGRDDWDVAGLTELLDDKVSPVAPRFVEGLVRVATDEPLEREAQAMLRHWDHRLGVESVGAAIYVACRVELMGIVSVELGLTNDRLGSFDSSPSSDRTARLMWGRLIALADDGDDELLAGVGGWDGAYAAALRAGVGALVAQLGGDPAAWRWGRLHTVRWLHPLVALRPDLDGRVVVPEAPEVGGDADCVHATALTPPSLEAVTGSVARYVFDLADWDRSTWIVPHGVSGDPRSPHFADQLPRWARGEMVPMRYSRPAVDDAVVSRSTIAP